MRRAVRLFSTRSVAFVCLLVGLVVLGAGCGPSNKTVKKDVKVIVTNPIRDRVIDYQDFTGRLEAVKAVDIRARVSGYVTEVFFHEGDRVEEGEPLFQIDVGPYLADYNQMEADLKLAVADRKLMEKNAERARNLWRTKSIPMEEYETTLAMLDKSIATVGSKTASKDKAKLYLDYTKVVAPVTGKISRRFVDPGNLITADTTVLTTVVTENPMYAYFDVDERTYLELLVAEKKAERESPGVASLEKRPANGNGQDWKRALGLLFSSPFYPHGLTMSAAMQDARRPVMMALANEKEFERVGQVDFVDNRVGAMTGTVRMRGVFPNPNGVLTAGLFMRVRLPIGIPYDAVLIPDEAIQSDQERKYVWVIDADNKAQYRSVRLGQAVKELRVILPPDKGQEGKEGLTVTDRVVISGVQRVASGRLVEAKTQPPAAPPGMPLVKLWERTNK